MGLSVRLAVYKYTSVKTICMSVLLGLVSATPLTVLYLTF